MSTKGVPHRPHRRKLPLALTVEMLDELLHLAGVIQPDEEVAWIELPVITDPDIKILTEITVTYRGYTAKRREEIAKKAAFKALGALFPDPPPRMKQQPLPLKEPESNGQERAPQAEGKKRGRGRPSGASKVHGWDQ